MERFYFLSFEFITAPPVIAVGSHWSIPAYSRLIQDISSYEMLMERGWKETARYWLRPCEIKNRSS